MKTVLITGASGFIGKNLTAVLMRRHDVVLRFYDLGDSAGQLQAYLKEADVVYHMAGVNRPEHIEEFESGNFGLTSEILAHLRAMRRRPVIVFSSSVQAALDNPYGRSKARAEAALGEFAVGPDSRVFVYRLTNVFGKWCRPNYNSVVATFCHNIANNLNITISDPNKELELVYIDDVVRAFASHLEGEASAAGLNVKSVTPTYKVTLGELAERISSFREIRRRLMVPDLKDRFNRCLYATYLSYLNEGTFSYALEIRSDARGALAELLKSNHFGQIFISRTKPGVTRGNHFHDTKVEKFCVLEGEALIRLRRILDGRVCEYKVRGSEFNVVDIPPGYAHSIENVGKTVMITLFWADEIFDQENPDTYGLKVLP